jgi:hypothetical protein
LAFSKDKEKTMQDSSQSLKYVSEQELSAMIGRSRSSLQKDRFYRRGIPYVKNGKNVRYSVRDAQDYMAARRINPAEQV